MLHHPTLLSPFLHQPSRFSSQGMEVVALKKSKRPEAPALHNHGVGGGGSLAELNFNWIAEGTSGFFGEEFSVDDLLDFEGLDDKEILNEEEEVVDDQHRQAAAENSKLISSTDSDLTFQPSAPTAEIALPVYQADDDEAELEWVSRFVDDSYSSIPSCEVPAAVAVAPLPSKRVAGPTELLVPVKAKRSKRPRILGASWCTSSTSSCTTTTSSSPSSSSCASSSFSSSPLCLVYDYYPSFANTELFSPEMEKQKHKKKRGRKPKKQEPATAAEAEAAASGAGERRCSHCGVSKTPQWRAGPMGTKTLCNACGVRFKSGRLLPEYRPACSPTFSPALHSNSHRKVLEMRHQKEQEKQLVGSAAVAAVPVAS